MCTMEAQIMDCTINHGTLIKSRGTGMEYLPLTGSLSQRSPFLNSYLSVKPNNPHRTVVQHVWLISITE